MLNERYRFEKFKRVFESILTAEEEAGPCSFRASISGYVDAQLAGEDVTELYPEMRDHLQECLDCHEEYTDSYVILEAERKGELQEPPREGKWDFGFLKEE